MKRLLKRTNGIAARAIRLVFLPLLACLPLFASSCMVWPGLTAIMIDTSDDNPSGLPLLLALLGGNGLGGGSGSGGGCLGQGYCWIFVIATGGGNLSGATGADTWCANGKTNNFPALPGTYRALLMTNDLARDPTHNWVLYANTTYRSASNGNAIVGQTDASATFAFPLANRVSGVATNVWTGSGATWTPSLSNCTNWTDSTLGNSGSIGDAYSTNSTMIGTTTHDCNGSVMPVPELYCVQQ